MEWQDDGIIVGGRRHGETSAVISLLTREHGRHPGLLRGARTARLRGIAEIGNRVQARWYARLDDNLGIYSIELVETRAPEMMSDGDRLQAMAAAAAIVHTAFPEREPASHAFEHLVELMGHLSSSVDWPQAYVRWEVSVLAALGYGLALECCAVSGTAVTPTWVSPRTGRAVSAAAGAPYADRLLRLPPFLASNAAAATADDVITGLTLTAYFLNRHVYGPDRKSLPGPRLTLAERLHRRSGAAPA